MVGIAVYTTGLAEALVRRGHEVQVVAGKPYYPGWKVPADFKRGYSRRTTEAGVDLTRVAHYVPADPTGFRRIVHHVTFALSAFIPTLIRAIAQRPDVVLTIAPSLIATPVARLAAAVTGARSWLHIQDFEVEAAMATSLIGGAGLGARAARWFEWRMLTLFGRVSSISSAMCHKLVEKGVPTQRIIELRNWADIDRIVPLDRPSTYRAKWGITTPYVALYSGNIANKQGIDIVIAAARRLQHRTDLTFVVCGDGPNRAKLERRGADLSNIIFRDLQPKEELKELLGLATIHILPQLATAADLVLPSKLANMLASGRPVVATAHLGTGLADEVEGCGLVVAPEDETAFADAIEQLLDNEVFRDAFAIEARRRAQARWECDAIIDGLERALFDAVEKPTGVHAPLPRA